MELHHHPVEHHEKKTFKDYFLEFMMIFLAVSLGFLAENFREYITDYHHVEELALQLRQDLESDTVKIQNHIEFQKLQARRADSLYAILIQPPGQIDYKKLQDMVVDCERMEIFYPSTGAIETIKKELHLKKFVKTRIAKHIDYYERGIAMIQKLEEHNLDYLGKYLETFISNHFTPENVTAAVTRSPVINGNMRNMSPAVLTQLSVDINLIKAYNLQLLGRYETVKSDATGFIKHINNTYRLEE
jgi:hypothetical protein